MASLQLDNAEVYTCSYTTVLDLLPDASFLLLQKTVTWTYISYLCTCLET